MALSTTDVRDLNALTALEEGRQVDPVVLRALVDLGHVANDAGPQRITLEGKLRLRNLRSQVRGEIERGLDGFAGGDGVAG